MVQVIIINIIKGASNCRIMLMNVFFLDSKNIETLDPEYAKILINTIDMY